MGALPIVLALSGFVLLWAIVNYNSFTEKRNTIQQMLEQRVNLLRVRTDLLVSMAALFQKHDAFLPPYVNDLINNPGKLSAKTQMEAALSQMHAMANSHPQLLKSIEDNNLRVRLVENTNQLLKLQNLLTGSINYYNKQTSSMPYRIIATLFRFKPVRE